MIKDVCKLVDCLKDECCEYVAETVIECIEYKLQNCLTAEEYSGGNIDMFVLLAILMQFGDKWLKTEYDPCANFSVEFKYENMEEN